MISRRKIKYSCHDVPKIYLEACHYCFEIIPSNYNSVSPAHKQLLTTLSMRFATKQDPSHAAQSQEPGPEAVNPELSHSIQPIAKLQTLQGEKQSYRPDCMEAQAGLSLSCSRPTGCKIFKVSLRMYVYTYPRRCAVLAGVVVLSLHFHTTLTNFSTRYLVMCKVYTDVGGIK